MDLFIINTTWPTEDENIKNFWSFIMNTTINVHVNDTVDDDSGSVYEVPTLILVLLSIFYGTIAILAIVGNFVVMLVIATSKRMQNVTNIYIANLALSDIVIGLFAIPFQFQAALLQRWNLPYFMCAFCPFVQILSVNVSVFTLTAIAIDRHRAILRPLSVRPSKMTAKIVIAGIWLLAITLATPVAIARKVRMVPDGTGNLKPFCQAVDLSHETMLIYSTVLAFLQYLTPLSIIFCVYTRMALKLWGNRAPGNAQDCRDANLTRNKKRVIKMLIMVVVIFAVCWLPLQAYNVLQYFYPEINKYKYIHYIFFCSDWLAMSNSCYNPFIYGIYNENFRREFKERCPCKSRRMNDAVDMDKTQSTKCSVRYEWKRSTSSSCPSVSSFYKGLSTRGSTQSFVNGRKANERNKKSLGHYIRRGDHCANGNDLLSSGRRKRSENFGSEETSL